MDNLMEGWEEDMYMPDGVEFNSCGKSSFYFDESVQRSEYEDEDDDDDDDNDLVNTNHGSKHFRGLDFSYIHDQDMNYYHETYDYYHSRQDDVINGLAPMLGEIEPAKTNADYDSAEDEEFNELLAEIEQNDIIENIDQIVQKDVKAQDPNDDFSGAKDQYEDYYDEFTQVEEEQIPDWYELMLQKKIKETKRRLEELSSLVCYASASTKNQITRIERDHNTPFCKLDYPRHPPLKKAWNNYWRFNCVIKCKVDPPEPEHAHTQDCEMLILEHVGTGTSLRSKNILPNEFPDYVMHTVELFQEFAVLTSKNPNLYSDNDIPDTTYERPMWTYIKIRSNYKDELMLIACGKGVSPLIQPLKRFFFGRDGRGRVSNVVSLYCINIKWSQKKSLFPPTYVTGTLELRDKIGPISINYNAKTNINFNSAEAEQLGRIMFEYLAPTAETTVVDIGCNFGILSLMLAQKCDKVVGFNTLDHEIKLAEDVKVFNNVFNASFFISKPQEVFTKCASLLKKQISVAILNLATPFGKSHDVMKALRNLPSVWRVAVYGPFTREFHKHITILTSKDDQMGDEFLPMQGCILDKSASIPNAFDIVILFERRSLIEPSIELIASGPTVNIKVDPDSSWNIKSEKPEKTLEIKSEKGFGNEMDNVVKNPTLKPYIPKHLRVTRKFGKFDSPLLPKEKKDLKPEIPLKPVETFLPKPSLPINAKVKQLKKMYDSPPIVPKTEKIQPVCPPARPPEPIVLEPGIPLQSKPVEEKSEYVPITACLYKEKNSEYVPITANNYHGLSTQYPVKEVKSEYVPITALKALKKQFDSPKLITTPRNQIKLLKKQYDCPPLPSAVKQEKQNQNSPLVDQNSPPMINQDRLPVVSQTSPSAVEQTSPFYHQSKVKQEKQFDSPPSHQQQNGFNYQPTFKLEVTNPPLPPMHYPPPPPEEYIPLPPPDSCPPIPKEEPQVHVSPVPAMLKVKPVFELDKEREEGELSEESGSSPRGVIIKSEPMDLDDDLAPSNIVCEALVKCEPISSDSCSGDYSAVRIKSEPVDEDEQDQQLSTTNATVECTYAVKQEPEEVKSSPYSIDDIENMPTPVHRPANVKNSSLQAESANFTVDGFQFSVKPNQSFLAFVKSEPETTSTALQQQPAVVNVKKEKSVEQEQQQIKQISSQGDDEICIIAEKNERKPIKLKSQDEIKKEKISDDLDSCSSDLRDLLEVQRSLKKKLKDERSDDFERSASPTERFNKYNRSSSKPARYRTPVKSPERTSWNKRALSPYSPDSRRFKRSPSPFAVRRNRRSPPSPSSSYRRGSPYSTDKKYRYVSPVGSPSERRYRRGSPSYGRSPSPSFSSKKYYKTTRSPPSPYANRKFYRDARSPSSASSRSRYGGRSPSPMLRRYPRSPSTDSRKYARSPSPFRRKFVRSPSTATRKLVRSPSPLSRRLSARSPSPVSRRLSARLPSPVSRRLSARSPSPLSRRLSARSPSPVSRKPSARSPSSVVDRKSKRSSSPTASLNKKVKRKKRSKSPSEKKKSKKDRKKDRSRSTSTTCEMNQPSTTSKVVGDNGDWDIPALSALTDSPLVKKEVSPISVSVAVEQETS